MDRQRRPLLTLTTLTLLVLLAGTLVQAQPIEFGLSPGEIELAPPPGGTASATLLVMNTSARRMRFTVKIEDIFIRPTGEVNLLEAGKLSWSVARLSRITPPEFDLEPSRAMPVRITVTVPSDARGGLYGAIVVSSAPVLQTSAGPRGTVSLVKPKLIARLLVPVRGTEVVRGAIVNMLAAPQPGGKVVEIKVVFRNGGNVHVRTVGDVTILDAAGQQVEKIRLPEALVLPSSIREFKVSWEAKNLEPGSYTIRAVIDYGADVLVSGEVGFTFRKP